MASITKRAGRNGRVSWGVRIRISGYTTLSKSFPTKHEAQRWASGFAFVDWTPVCRRAASYESKRSDKECIAVTVDEMGYCITVVYPLNPPKFAPTWW